VGLGHVSCHADFDQGQIDDVALELPAGGQTRMTPVIQCLRGREARRILLGGVLNNLVVAPLLYCRRSLVVDEMPRQRTEVVGVGTIQGAKEGAEMLWRISGSP
jgi:hypothetical protein